jgi:hypothetical protein
VANAEISNKGVHMTERTFERASNTTQQKAALVFNGWLPLDEVERQEILVQMQANELSDDSGKEEIRNTHVENLKTGPTPSACPCCGR